MGAATVNKMMDFVPSENDYDNLELVPPPLFTKQEMPFDYRYEIVQNVLFVKDMLTNTLPSVISKIQPLPG
jgi:hypothetical protein